jgi:hypothetical protein
MTRAASPPDAVAASGRSGSAGPADSRKVTLSRPVADSRNRPLLLSPAGASLLLLLLIVPLLSDGVSRGCGCAEVGTSTAREDGPAWQLAAGAAAAAVVGQPTNAPQALANPTCAFLCIALPLTLLCLEVRPQPCLSTICRPGHAPDRVPAKSGTTQHKHTCTKPLHIYVFLYVVYTCQHPYKYARQRQCKQERTAPVHGPAALLTCCSACPTGVQLMSTANLLLPMASWDRQPCTAWASAPAAARRPCDSASAALLISDCSAAASARHASAWPAGQQKSAVDKHQVLCNRLTDCEAGRLGEECKPHSPLNLACATLKECR